MKLKRSLVFLLSVNLLFSSIQLPVFANETNELEIQASVSMNSDLEETDIVECLAEEETTEESVLETESTVTIGSGVGKVSSNTSSTTNKYSAAWQYWSQGASKYKGMRSSGCRVTAFAKLLYEAGYTSVGNPDNFLVWGVNNGFFQSTSNVLELGTFGGAISKYVSDNGGKCTLIANNTLTGNTSTDKANIMNYIRQGYYVVLSCSSHTAYIGRDISISCGQPVIFDSWSSWSTNPATAHTYTGTYDSMSKVTFTRYRVYSIVSQAVTKDTIAPTIKDINLSNIDNTGYTVSCTVTDNFGISKVQFPTWTNKNGQDDIAWKDGSRVGSNTSQSVTFRVNVSEHNNEEGTYNTHIYAWDTSGNVKSYPIQTYIDRTPPTITNVKISNVDSTGYTVTCNVTDNLYVNRVQFPTWTELNGQDDIISEWWNNSSASGMRSGTTFTYRVNCSAHNKELCNYNTHIYAYDDYGNYSVAITGVKCLLGEKVNLGISFNAYIKTKFDTYLTAETDGNIDARIGDETTKQKWHFERMSDGYYVITNKNSGKAIDVERAGDINATNIQAYDPNGLDNQKWGIYNSGDGSYIFVSKYSSKNVMDSKESGVNGSNIYIYEYHGGQNQRFVIQKYESYTVTLNATAGGNVSGGGTFNNGTTITVKATPNSGYEFEGWYSGTTKISSSPNYSFTINNNLAYTAKFKEIETAPISPAPINPAPVNPTPINPTPIPPTTPTNATDTQVSSFINRMYTVALGREADENGLNYWIGLLSIQKIDGAGIAKSFMNSAEFKNRNLSNSDYLDVLYRTFFDRAADAEGKAYWMDQLQKGIPRTQVLSCFVNSQEFSSICDRFGIARGTMQTDGNSIYRPGVRSYVLRMYTKALNRNGETSGVEYWTNCINTRAMNPEAVAKRFFFSQEFSNRHLGNEDYVETLYQTFMDRASDKEGKQYWLNHLNNGMSRQQVLEGFARSKEFAMIMKRYGL